MFEFFNNLCPTTKTVLLVTTSAAAGAGALWTYQHYTEDEKVIAYRKQVKEENKKAKK